MVLLDHRTLGVEVALHCWPSIARAAQPLRVPTPQPGLAGKNRPSAAAAPRRAAGGLPKRRSRPGAAPPAWSRLPPNDSGTAATRRGERRCPIHARPGTRGSCPATHHLRHERPAQVRTESLGPVSYQHCCHLAGRSGHTGINPRRSDCLPAPPVSRSCRSAAERAGRSRGADQPLFESLSHRLNPRARRRRPGETPPVAIVGLGAAPSPTHGTFSTASGLCRTLPRTAAHTIEARKKSRILR